MLVAVDDGCRVETLEYTGRGVSKAVAMETLVVLSVALAVQFTPWYHQCTSNPFQTNQKTDSGPLRPLYSVRLRHHVSSS